MTEVSRTNRVNLALEQQRNVVYKLFELLCLVSVAAAPIYTSYAQAAILNLPEIVSNYLLPP